MKNIKGNKEENRKLRTRRMDGSHKVANVLNDIVHAVDIIAISIASTVAWTL